MRASLPQELSDTLSLRGLIATGAFAPRPEDALGPAVQTVLLLSPGPDFWGIFTASHEYQGGKPHPMDRWSARTIGRLARELRAEAYFPFGPKPAPFFGWATRGGRVWQSPVRLLAGADMGLNISFRGALGLPARLELEESDPTCTSCRRPCVSACPVGALSDKGYDVPACQAYLNAHPDSACRSAGCLVRRACPMSSPQSAEHARFHMDAFLT